MTMKCDDCGAVEGRLINSRKHGRVLCRKCYDIRQIHGNFQFHELPAKGEIIYDKSGKPICHICGMATTKLMQHVVKKHHMSAYEYKKEFGLRTTKSVISEDFKQVISNNITDKSKDNLTKGEKTRFTTGHKNVKTRDKLSLQELKNRIGKKRR